MRPPLHSATGLATNSRPFKTASVDSGGSLIDRESHESAAEVLGVPGHQVGDTLVIGGRRPSELCLR